jgi:hypothetical protein
MKYNSASREQGNHLCIQLQHVVSDLKKTGQAFHQTDGTDIRNECAASEKEAMIFPPGDEKKTIVPKAFNFTLL